MGKLLRCPLPCHPDSHHHDSDHPSSQPTSSNPSSDSSSSSSNSSLCSQPSLPCVPSLTPDSQTPSDAARCLATVTAHSSYIFALAVSGSRLFTAASNGEIRVWDRSSLKPIAALDGRSAVKAIVSGGRSTLLTAHHDHKIRAWKISGDKKFKLAATLPTALDRCTKLFWAKNYVRVRRHKRCTWVHHADAVSGLALSADGAHLYSVSWDRSMKVWRARDFKCVESIHNAHDDAINAVVVSSGGLVFTGSADKLIKVWKNNNNNNKHSLVGVLEKHKSAINALAMSEDGRFLYSGACDRSIIVWGQGGEEGGGWGVAGALRGHKKAILCLGVVRDLLCSGSADKTVRIWRTGNTYSCLAVLEGHKSPVKCLTAITEEEKEGELGNSYLVYSGGLDFDIKVWQIRVY